MSSPGDARPEEPGLGRDIILVAVNSLEIGGTERQIMELCRGLRDGFCFHVVTIHSGGPLVTPLREAGIPVTSLLPTRAGEGGSDVFSRTRRFVTAAWRLRRLIHALRPGLLHVHLPESSFIAAVARWPRRGPPLIISRRSLAGRIAQERFYLPMARWTNAQSDLVLTNSRAVRDDVVRMEGVDPGRVEIVHNGVDTGRFQPGPADPTLRASLGLPGDIPVIGMVANFHGYKGHADLLRAAAELWARGRRFSLLFIGRDGNASEEVHRLIREFGLPHVAFASVREDIPQLLRVMDVFVSASHEEGFSNSILEAMASGRPVLATAVGGSPEQIVDGASGLLVPARQPAALAAGLERLLSDPELCRRLGEAARRRAEEHFSLPALLQRMAEIYRGLTARENAGRRDGAANPLR